MIVSGNGAVANTTFAAAAGCTWQVVPLRQFTAPTEIVAPLLFKNVNMGIRHADRKIVVRARWNRNACG